MLDRMQEKRKSYFYIYFTWNEDGCDTQQEVKLSRGLSDPNLIV